MTPTDAELLGRSTSPLPAGRPGRLLDLALLDRDGTLNVRRPGYVRDPEDLRLLPGAARAVRLLNDAGAVVVLVTNQRGLSTGRLTGPELLAVHRALVARLARCGARLDGVQVCPHDEGTCGCRKPMPGLLEQAFARAPWARAHRSLLIGDQPSDLAAAGAAGVPARQVGAVRGDLVAHTEQALRAVSRVTT